MLRGLFSNSGSGPVLRITRPGADVSTAQDYEHLLHENFLYSQPYFFTYVACSFGGSQPAASVLTETHSLTVPGIDTNPIVLVFPFSSSISGVCFPSPISTGVGNITGGWPLEIATVSTRVVSSVQIDVTFSKEAGFTLVPYGAYVVVLRRPT